MTVDSIDHLGTLVDALRALPRRPWVRLVFDVSEPASYYLEAAREISTVGQVMGDLVDSSDLAGISAAAVGGRARRYLAVLGRYVAVWEVGNEVNGNWVGPYDQVSAKLSSAFSVLAGPGRATALTLYGNDFGPDHCGDGPAEPTPSQFSERYVPPRLRNGVDYVFLSYYPEQCGGLEPTAAQLGAVLRPLHALYPAARLGIGETGLTHPVGPSDVARAAQMMSWAYAIDPGLDYYVGGYFWWYGAEDALGPGELMASGLQHAFTAEAAALARR